MGFRCGSFCGAQESRDEFITLGNGRWILATMAKLLAANNFEPDPI